MQGRRGRADAKVTVRHDLRLAPAPFRVPVDVEHVIGEGFPEEERALLLLAPRRRRALNGQERRLRRDLSWLAWEGSGVHTGKDKRVHAGQHRQFLVGYGDAGNNTKVKEV